MSITVKIVIGIVVLSLLAGSVFWWNSTKDERVAKAELETLIKFAQRQALEIAIIEQAAKLGDYKRQMKAQQTKAISGTPVSAPIADLVE